MAKAGFWLRGAKGKLAGSVLQKGENGTVQRELVTPANPQTAMMMAQRIAFATVSKAAKVMLPVIGQSFEGVQGEKLNRREFFRENVNRLKNDYIVYNDLRGTGKYVVPDTSAAVAKGISQIVPNSYVISKGSLYAPKYCTPQYNTLIGPDARKDYTANGISGTITVNPDSVLDIAQLLNVLGIKVGDQLTVCTIATLDGTSHVYDGENSDYMRYAHFTSARIVFSDDEDLYAENSINFEDLTAGAIGAAIRNVIDADKSNSSFVTDFINALGVEITEAGQSKAVIFDDFDPVYYTYDQGTLLPDSAYKTKALGAFISHLYDDGWRYSNSRMVALAPGNISPADTYHGLRYKNALPTYLKASDANSNLYTQQGGADNSIGI